MYYVIAIVYESYEGPITVATKRQTPSITYYLFENEATKKKYEDALEVIISDKNKDPERMKQLVEEIQTKRPDLKKRVEDLCLQYKVNL